MVQFYLIIPCLDAVKSGNRCWLGKIILQLGEGNLLVEGYNHTMQKVRLDLLLVERGMAESRSKAQALVMAGQVRVEGQVELKASTAVPAEARLDLDSGPRFVSRGGEKLEAALTAFPLDRKSVV